MTTKNLAPMDSIRRLAERMEGFLEKPREYFGGSGEPAIDVKETGKEIILTAKLPGYRKDELGIDLTEDSVTISGCKTTTKETRRHGMLRRESQEHSFSRSLALPASVKTDEAQATFKDGRLEVRLPRVKETSVRRLSVG